jgi:hypothetical protein
MVRYFLNLFHDDDDLPNDHEPQDFPNLKAAKAEAIASLREYRPTQSRNTTELKS